MADFCKQCGIEMFGDDHGDLSGLSTVDDTKNGLFCCVLCEGCGPIQVDHTGLCISPDCDKHANEPERPRTFGMRPELAMGYGKKKLVISDLSNIEGRILAYLAGEEWKLQAFRDFDAGNGADLYNITAAGIIGGSPFDVSKKNRNIFGKVPDLALGYEGGAGALQTFAKAYGVLMEEQWPTIQQNIDPEYVYKARENLESWGRMKQIEMGISETEWIASETVKLAWRGRHPATRSLWYAVKDAAVNAIRSPGVAFKAGAHLMFQRVKHTSGEWLLCRLPSGKFLTYYDPQLTADGGISYMGMGTENGQQGARVWCALYTYGGKLVENATQAVAGDALKATMPAIEAAGYEIVLTVHDEDVTQTPDTDAFSADALSELLATPPTWAPTLPLSAAGFEAYRYKKED